MKQNNKKEIIINKSDIDLDNFYNYKFKLNLNRVTFIFLVIFIIFVLYSTRIIFLSSKTLEANNYKVNKINRADIFDRNGNFISKTVFTTNVGIDPKLVKDKKKLLLKLQYTFAEKDFSEIKKKFMEISFFI